MKELWSAIESGSVREVAELLNGEVTVVLTRREALALFHAWEIEEYPVSNPLGRDADEFLRSARRKLEAAVDAP